MEMVLSFMLSLKHSEVLPEGWRVEFLSCGTDGIDGPTDGAGAVWSNDMEGDFEGGYQYLEDNDSYSYWEKNGGLVKTGHTGTNVMDVQILIISKSQKL